MPHQIDHNFVRPVTREDSHRDLLRGCWRRHFAMSGAMVQFGNQFHPCHKATRMSAIVHMVSNSVLQVTSEHRYWKMSLDSWGSPTLSRQKLLAKEYYFHWADRSLSQRESQKIKASERTSNIEEARKINVQNHVPDRKKKLNIASAGAQNHTFAGAEMTIRIDEKEQKAHERYDYLHRHSVHLDTETERSRTLLQR